MNNEEQFDEIAQVIHDVMQKAEVEPPDEAWQKIATRMNAGTGKPVGRRKMPRWQLYSMVTVVSIAAAVGLTVLAQRGDDNKAIVASPELDSAEAFSTAVVDATPDQYNGPIAMISSHSMTQNVIVNNALDDNVSVEEQATQVTHPQMTEPESEIPHVQPQQDTTPSILTPREPQNPADETSNKANATVTNTATANDSTPHEVGTSREPERAVNPQDLVIPNLLTPNGDGYNDCWIIDDLDKCGAVQLEIYNAQSRCVYRNSRYMNNYCGDDLPAGNYFYILKFYEHSYIRRGALVIKR